MNNTKFFRLFILSCSAMLIITSLFKLISAGGDAKILAAPDPIFHFSNRKMYLSLGLAELLLSLYLIFGKSPTIQICSIAWLSSCFALYRLSLWALKIPSPCSCLGNAADWLGVSPKHLDLPMQAILIYLIIGSYGFLLSDWISELLAHSKMKDGGLHLSNQQGQ